MMSHIHGYHRSVSLRAWCRRVGTDHHHDVSTFRVPTAPPAPPGATRPHPTPHPGRNLPHLPRVRRAGDTGGALGGRLPQARGGGRCCVTLPPPPPSRAVPTSATPSAPPPGAVTAPSRSGS